MTRVRRRTYWAAEARGHLPAAAIPLLHQLRLRQDLRTPRVLAQARSHMEFLVGEAMPEADVDELARRYLDCLRWRIETRWHPEVFLPPVRVEGVEHLAAGFDGAVVNFLHHGPYERLGLSLSEVGHELHMMMAAFFFADDVPPWLRRHRVITERGTPVFSASEGSDGVRRRLAEGKLVGLATDMPGRTPVTFLGREVLGTFGAARLAHEAGKPVLVATSHQGADGAPWLRIHEPLLPERFPDARALLEAMLRIHEPAVLAWPEAYEEPRSKWGEPVRDVATPAA